MLCSNTNHKNSLIYKNRVPFLDGPMASFIINLVPIIPKSCLLNPVSSSSSSQQMKNKIFIENPSMNDILESSRSQNIELNLQTLGPFFQITATSLETNKLLGKAEGMIRLWFNKGKILHLESIKLTRETLTMDRSVFGIGLFIGALMIRYGYDSGCQTAQLLAINDSDLYHAKLVKFYRRIGFETVYEVTGSSMRDLIHMLVWGGVGTRMDANLERLLVKWCTRFTTNTNTNTDTNACSDS